MPHKRNKKEYQVAVRINISLPPGLDNRKGELLRKYELPDFSSYIQARMRRQQLSSFSRPQEI